MIVISSKRKHMTQNYVYAILNSKDNAVKIGFSADPFKRLGQIQTNNVNKLELLLMFQGDSTIENAIHKELALFHLSGEWFRFCPSVILVLSKYMTNQFDSTGVLSYIQSDRLEELEEENATLKSSVLEAIAALEKIELEIPQMAINIINELNKPA